MNQNSFVFPTTELNHPRWQPQIFFFSKSEANVTILQK